MLAKNSTEITKESIDAKTQQYTSLSTYCPLYLNEIFEFAPHYGIDTRSSFAILEHPFRNSNARQKILLEHSTRTH